MGTRNDDEPNRSQSIEFRLESRRDWDGRMQDEPFIGEPEHGHTNRDRDQAGLPAKLVLTAPEIGVMLD